MRLIVVFHSGERWEPVKVKAERENFTSIFQKPTV